MTSGSLRCGRRLQPAAFCDAPAPLWSAVPLSGTVHKEGVYSVSITDAFPSSSIPAFCGRITLVFFVPLILQLLMFLAEPSIREVGTAGVGAWAFRFIFQA